MSKLRIQHRTQYRYSGAVEFGRHRLVLRPREGHDLRVLSMSLQITPTHQLTWTRDVYGNSVALIDFEEPAAFLEFYSDVVVEQWPSFPRPLEPKRWDVAFPVQYDDMEGHVAGAYQALTFAEDLASVQGWINATLPLSTRTDAEEMVSRLCGSIKTEIQYLRRSEKGVQRPSVTLQLRKGSCRDTATLMLEAARSLGIASRFVSGYLHCAASEAGRASTHAWIEVYLPGLGWRGFDPSIGEAVSNKHIPVGVSEHPRGVMPICGLWNADDAQFLDMTVQVSTTELSNELRDLVGPHAKTS